MEGFGQTETTLVIANLVGNPHKLGAMGLPSPQFDVTLLDRDGNLAEDGETGEICIKTSDAVPCGLFAGYYLDEEKTREAWHEDVYKRQARALSPYGLQGGQSGLLPWITAATCWPM